MSGLTSRVEARGCSRHMFGLNRLAKMVDSPTGPRYDRVLWPPDEREMQRCGHLIQVGIGVLIRLNEAHVSHIRGIFRVYGGRADFQSQIEDRASACEVSPCG